MSLPLVVWALVPADPLLVSVLRPCSRCSTERPFRPTGTVRVNAHQRRLDVTVTTACAHCGRTWKLPVARHVAVRSVSDLRRLEANDPDCLRAILTDPDVLAGHRVQPGPVRLLATVPSGPSEIRIRAVATDLRLDRVIAMGLGISRSTVRRLVADGALEVSERALRRPPTDGLRFVLRRMGPARQTAVGDE